MRIRVYPMFVAFLQKKNLEIGFLHKIGALYKLEVCGAPAPLAAEGPEKGDWPQRKGPLKRRATTAPHWPACQRAQHPKRSA
jgi:hypothetical protein